MGMAGTLVLVVYAVSGGPGAAVVRWLALAPLFAGLLHQSLSIRAHKVAPPRAETDDALQAANADLQRQVNELTRLRDVMLALSATFDRSAVLNEITRTVTDLLNFDRGLVLVHDPATNTLNFAAFSHAAPDRESQFLLEQLQ